MVGKGLEMEWGWVGEIFQQEILQASTHEVMERDACWPTLNVMTREFPPLLKKTI